MSVTLAMAASQQRAGADLRVGVNALATTPADSLFGYVGLGATTSATAPTTYADLAAHAGLDAAVFATTFWDRVYEVDTLGASNGTYNINNLRQRLTKRLALGDGFTAGRYLWTVAFPFGDPPSGSAAIAAHSSSYHIT